MPTYFKPLRRKIGVMTLVVACAFAGGYVRSLEQDDYFAIFHVTHRTVHYLQSVNGRLLWWCQEPDKALPDPGPPYVYWETRPISVEPDYFVFADRSIFALRWGFHWFTIGGDKFFSIKPTKLSGGIQLFFSYWLIVLPLTLLSAWLLLSKPMVPKPSTESPPKTES